MIEIWEKSHYKFLFSVQKKNWHFYSVFSTRNAFPLSQWQNIKLVSIVQEINSQIFQLSCERKIVNAALYVIYWKENIHLTEIKNPSWNAYWKIYSFEYSKSFFTSRSASKRAPVDWQPVHTLSLSVARPFSVVLSIEFSVLVIWPLVEDLLFKWWWWGALLASRPRLKNRFLYL